MKKNLSGTGSAFLVLTLFILGAVISCDNTFGVFQSIQTEKKQSGTDVFLNANVKAVTEDGSNFYAAMAKIYFRPKDGSAGWNLLAVDDSTEYFCNSIAGNDTSGLYAAISSSTDNSFLGIFKSTNGGSTWTAVTSTNLSGLAVDGIWLVNGTLFVAAHGNPAENNYKLYYDDGSGFALAGAGLGGLASGILSVAFDGTSYWAATSSTLYKGLAGSMAEEASAGSPKADTKTVGGMCTDALAGKVFVTTADGLLYTYQTGAWTKATVETSLPLGPIAMPGNPSADYLIIAKSDAYDGYSEFKLSDSTYTEGMDGILVNATESLYASTVYGKPVNGFYGSKDGKSFFIALSAQGTSTYGLYRTDYDIVMEKWSGWTAE